MAKRTTTPRPPGLEETGGRGLATTPHGQGMRHGQLNQHAWFGAPVKLLTVHSSISQRRRALPDGQAVQHKTGSERQTHNQ
jgi:hypothetical protein